MPVDKSNPSNVVGSIGQAGHVSGSHSGASKDQIQKEHAHDGYPNLANQPEKIVSGRFSPLSHLDRTRLKK